MAQSVGPATLFGRLPELELLNTVLERVAAGTLHPVFIEGEAGIGKTRIVEALLQRARGRGFRTFVGGGDEIERARPFGPLAQALGCTLDATEPKRAEVARLLAGEPPAGPGPVEFTHDPGLQFRVVDALVDLVEEVALAGPVALVLEDLQWADPATLITVRSLVRQLAYLPVALVATLRPVPRPPEVEKLAGICVREGGHWLALSPLEDRAVAALVAELVAAAPAQALLEKVAGAAGNPLFVIELVKALVEQDAVLIAGGHADLKDASLPPSVRQAILRRTGFLPDQALELLHTASVLGSTFSMHDLATVLGHPATELLRPVRDAIRAKVFEQRADKLGFRHDLIREAIYEDLPSDVRAALHLHAGRRLAAAGAPTLQVAGQLALGARRGDAEAVQWLHAGAREAARQSPAVAVRLLERALELTGDADDRRPRLVADLVPILLWSGQPHRAEAYARQELAGRVPPEVTGTLRLGLVSALTAQGRVADVVVEARRALDQDALTAEVRSRLQAEEANALAIVGDLDGAQRVARQAVATGTPLRTGGATMGLLVLADVARGRGHLRESLDHARQARQRAREPGADHLPWHPEIFQAMALRELDRFDEAHQAIRSGQLADERLGNVSYLPVYHYESATISFAAGHWDDAVAHAQSGLALAEDVGLRMLLSWPHGLLGLVTVHRGELEAAAAWIGAGGQRDLEVSESTWLTLAWALLREAHGDRAAALALLERAWDRQLERGRVDRQRLFGPDLVRLALDAGRRALAEQVTVNLEAAAARAGVPGLEAAAAHCRGLVEDDSGFLLRSVAAYRSGPRAFERAAACQDAATALCRAGRTAAAKPLFDEALEVYDRAGAQRQIARALAAMRAHGVGRKRRGARKRPATGWAALTPSEREVVALAAQGLTNPAIGARLFISRRTVQTHLGHAFRKLGISSRVELAAEVARRATSG